MPRSRTSWLLLVLLTASLLGLAFVAKDRTHLYEVVALSAIAGGALAGLWKQNELSLRNVLFGAVVFRLLMIWIPPSLSDDAFRYLWDGLVQVEGINPYRYTPDDPALHTLQQVPLYALLNSKSYYSVYPPVSQGIFALGALVHSQGWLFGYYLIKGLLVLMELMAVFWLGRMVDARSLLLYAWNPLVLLETAGQAHTESVLLLLLVLTIYLAQKKQGAWAAVVLAAAGWVKLYPFVLLPFLWRRFRGRAVWPAALVIIVLAAPYAAPYVLSNVRSSLDLYARLFEFNAGLYYLVKQVFYLATGDDWSKQIGPAFRFLFLAALPIVYLLDARYKWPLARAFLVTIGLFLALATTVHPWYLLSVLLLAALLHQPAWHWYWLGFCAIGTYLLYVEGPYWEFVILGWGGWLVLAGIRYGPGALQALQRRRARHKYRLLRPYLPRLIKPLAVLDLGAGEGYVGQVVEQAVGARVTLADVVSMNRTALPHIVYDGLVLPFEDDAFDASMLSFVLHHAEHQRQVIRETKRVTRGRVLILESVYEGTWDLRLLTFLDKLANRLRSGGLMKAQEEHLQFRTVDAWRAFFQEEGMDILVEQRRGRWIHKQALFVLTPPGPK